MPYRRFLREQNIYVPDKIPNPNLQSPPPGAQQLYQSPPQQQGQQGQLFQSPGYATSPLPAQIYHSPTQGPIYQSPPAGYPSSPVQVYASPSQVTYFQSPQQVSPSQYQQQQQASPSQFRQHVDRPTSANMYNPQMIGQPLPPGVLGRVPRNGTIVQQHTHYPFAQQQQPGIPVHASTSQKPAADHPSTSDEPGTRPLFAHHPSSSSLVSEDPTAEDGKKGGKKGKKAACAGAGKAGKEKSKAKACIYCRRSHMVCDHERPCARCIKRGIQNLCIEDGLHQANTRQSGAEQDEHSSSVKRSQSPATTGEGSSRRKRQKSSSSGGQHDPMPGAGTEPSQSGSMDYWPSGQELRSSGDIIDTGHVAQGISPSQISSRVNMYNLSTSGNTGTGDLRSTGVTLPPAWPMLPSDATTAEKIEMHTSHLKGNPTLSGAPGGDVVWGTTKDGREEEEDGAGIGGASSFESGIPSVNEPLHGSTSSGIPPQATVTNYGTTATERLSRQVQGGEFGVLSDFLESLGIPSLPGGLGDIFGDSRLDLGPSGVLGDGFGGDAEMTGDGAVVEEQGEVTVKAEDETTILPKASKAEKYFLAAADQASGTRDERLARVIKAKYEAGLLKPYDYSRGYAKMYKWLEKNVPSPTTRQAILRPLSVFRPAFRAISQTLSDIDLVFVEEAFERLMLDYDRVFSAIHTPACLWRRTGEIYKANKEFSVLTGIPSALLRGGKIGIYELMTEESMVQYYQLFGSIAFDSGRKSLHTICTLRIPDRLTKVNASSTTPLLGPGAYSTANTPLSSPKGPSSIALPASLVMTRSASQHGSTTPNQGRPTPVPGAEDSFRLVKCCFSFTIRRDSYGFPTAIVGNFIPL